MPRRFERKAFEIGTALHPGCFRHAHKLRAHGYRHIGGIHSQNQQQIRCTFARAKIDSDAQILSNEIADRGSASPTIEKIAGKQGLVLS